MGESQRDPWTLRAGSERGASLVLYRGGRRVPGVLRPTAGSSSGRARTPGGTHVRHSSTFVNSRTGPGGLPYKHRSHEVIN